MDVKLLYGRTGLRVSLPDLCHPTIIRKPAMPILSDSRREVDLAFSQPVNCEPLRTLAASAESACVLVCDITRPVPNNLFLASLLEQLMCAGISKDAILILIATGLHRANKNEELNEIIGDPWVVENFRIENHDARDSSQHVYLGKTSSGTVVKLDRRLVAADLKIATGLVEPHFMAGYSGGRKVIAPGVADADTISTLHSYRFLAHPKTQNCVLDGNPLHSEQLEIVEMLGGALAVYTVIDEDRRLAFINFGEIVDSHLKAVNFVRKYSEVPVSRKFRTVVTSSAGYPLDKTYYQTVKGMVGALAILEEGGRLIIASECSEGLGSTEYVQAQKRLIGLGVEQFLSNIEQREQALIDEWQTQMQVKSMKHCRVTLYTSYGDQLRGLAGVDVTEDIDQAIFNSVKIQKDPAVAIIPEGPYVIPSFVESASSKYGK